MKEFLAKVMVMAITDLGRQAWRWIQGLLVSDQVEKSKTAEERHAAADALDDYTRPRK